MRSPFAESPEFRRLLGGDAGVDLFRVGLEIARDAEPTLDLDAYLARVDSLADRVRGRCPASSRAPQILQQVNWVLFVEERFEGNVREYDDPRNSYLNEVLDRRTGIPITLSILYRRVAEGAGLEMSGVNLPGHFMLRVGSGDGLILVDPFHGGRFLDREGCARFLGGLLGRPVALDDRQLAPCPPRRVIGRMLRNLKAIHTRAGDVAACLGVQRRLAALSPDVPEEQRDLGLIALRLDRPGEALEPLRRYLDACPDAPEAEGLRRLLRDAAREVAHRN